MSVLSHLEETASGLVPSRSEKDSVERSLSALRDRLDTYFDDDTVVDHFQFGSWTRDTMLSRRADEQPDVDYMVVFDHSDRVKPEALLERLRKFADHHYRRSEIYRSRPTVVLSLNHIRFELVPARRSWFLGGLQIPARTSDFATWISTDPEGHTREVEAAEKRTDGLTRPAIRLMKYWNALHGRIYPSFELEQMVAGRRQWVWRDLKERLFTGVDTLPTRGLSRSARSEVDRAKDLVRSVRRLEAQGYAEYAECEVQKLFPALDAAQRAFGSVA